MGQLPLLLVAALVIAAIAFGVVVLITGSDPGLSTTEPDGRAVPLPADRPLVESDVGRLRFDTALRGYRMAQVDAALRRTAYDLGYKEELISVLLAETEALRDGRIEDADTLRQAREAALGPGAPAEPAAAPAIVVDAGSEPDAEAEPELPAEPEAAAEPELPAEADAAAEPELPAGADGTDDGPDAATGPAEEVGTAAADGTDDGPQPVPAAANPADQAGSRSPGRR